MNLMFNLNHDVPQVISLFGRNAHLWSIGAFAEKRKILYKQRIVEEVTKELLFKNQHHSGGYFVYFPFPYLVGGSKVKPVFLNFEFMFINSKPACAFVDKGDVLLTIFVFSFSQNPITISMNNGWQFSEAAKNEWKEAVVPGSVQSDLIRLGVLLIRITERMKIWYNGLKKKTGITK